MQGRILVIDDEKLVAATLCGLLQQDGYSTVAVHSGTEALKMVETDKAFDLAILDLWLGDMSGTDVCSELKKRGCDFPIMMLSGSATESDRVAGLDIGAEDYVNKPLGPRELSARVRVLLRRKGVSRRQVGPYEFDFERRVVTRKGLDLALSPKEFAIVALLLRRAPAIIKRAEILSEVWGPQFIGDEKTVAIHMRWIRQKLEERPNDPVYIKTAAGGGYFFQLPEESGVGKGRS